nr:MAG TPA: hypothetical protein [Caudoviricetes sp.]
MRHELCQRLFSFFLNFFSFFLNFFIFYFLFVCYTIVEKRR